MVQSTSKFLDQRRSGSVAVIDPPEDKWSPALRRSQTMLLSGSSRLPQLAMRRIRPRITRLAQVVPQRAVSKSASPPARERSRPRADTRAPTEFRNLPRVSNPSDEAKYVLTFLVNRELQETMDAWRRRYYPSNLNILPAHLMLFHALPEQHLSELILPALRDVSKAFTSYRIAAGKPTAMGKRGVCIKCLHPDHQPGHGRDLKTNNAEDTPSVALYKSLQRRWWDFLSDQDRSALRPHWTVMNKEADMKKVSEAYNTIKRWAALNEAGATHPREDPGSVDEGGDATASSPAVRNIGKVVGLTLWRYQSGRWEDPQTFFFETDNLTSQDLESLKEDRRKQDKPAAEF